MTDAFDLSGRVAVVTGGTRGIGLAVSKTLADAGANVVPTARTESAVEDAVEAVEALGATSVARPLDVADPDDTDAFFEEVVDAFGRLDIVVNNAGINPRSGMGTPDAVDIDAFDRASRVNARGGFLCARAGAEALAREGAGVVVNVASVSGLVGEKRQHAYVASKHALVGLTKSMALDWAPDVRINAVAPGYVHTALTEPIEANDQLYDSVLNRTPMERFADPQEVADPVLFLASDAASYLTGAVIPVDGGWTAR